MNKALSKINLRLILSILFILLVSDAYTIKGQVIASHTEDSITVQFYSSKSTFKKGGNRFELMITKDGSPYDAGTDLKVYFYMPAMPPTMPEMRHDAKIRPSGKTGLYKGKVKLEMGGTWQVNISYSGGKTMSFDIIAE